MNSDETVNEMDAQIVRAKFSSILRDSVLQCVTNAPSVWKGPNGQDYVYEQSLIERNTKPFLWGVGCTLVSFFSFRLSASKSFQQFRHQYIRKSAAAAPSKATLPHEQRQEMKKDLMNQALSVPKDLLLSIAIGISASAFLLDWNQIQQDLQRVPGLPGRSVLAESMCPQVIELYNSTPPRVWEQEGDDTLRSIRATARNCQRRARLEAVERQRLGLARDVPVAVPFPGFI